MRAACAVLMVVASSMILVAGSSGPEALQDRVIFKNGNAFDAQVMSIAEVSVLLRTSFGEMQAARRDIATILFGGHLVNIGLASGEKIRGILTDDGYETVTVKQGTTERKIGRQDIVTIDSVVRLQFDALGREVAEAPRPALGDGRQIRFLAVTKEGVAIDNLRPVELQLKVDGAEVPVESVAPSRPDRVSVLLDSSQSMVPWREEIITALDRFVKVLPKETAIQVLTFGDDIRQLDLKPDISGAVKGQPFQGGSLLYDALAAGVRIVSPDSRDAIVLITDGSDTGSAVVKSVAIEKLRGADVPCYTIGLGVKKASPRADANAIDQRFLKDVAEVSGGAFFLKDPNKKDKNPDLSVLLEKIAEQLAAMQSLRPGGSPITPGWHDIDLDTTRNNVKLYYKDWMYFPAEVR